MKYKLLKINFLVVLLLVATQGHAQLCNPNAVVSTPDSRFSYLGSGDTVLDAQTGLVWKVCGEGREWSKGSCGGEGGYYTWAAAFNHVKSLNTAGGYAGYSNWRVPSVKEMSSIKEINCYQPAINLSIFPGVMPLEDYWSSTPYASNSASAWHGDGEGTSRKNVELSLRLVRNSL